METSTMITSTAPSVQAQDSDRPKASIGIPRAGIKVASKSEASALRRKTLSSAIDDVTNKMPLLNIRNADVTAISASSSKVPSSPRRNALTLLLEVSNQAAPFDFDSFLSKFQFEELHDRHRTGRRLSFSQELPWRKIGEASFSEVFSVGDVVLKIIPLEYHGEDKGDDGAVRGHAKEPLPATSDPADVFREINATRLMGTVHCGFASLIR